MFGKKTWFPDVSYPLVMTNSLLLKIAIEIVDLPIHWVMIFHIVYQAGWFFSARISKAGCAECPSRGLSRSNQHRSWGAQEIWAEKSCTRQGNYWDSYGTLSIDVNFMGLYRDKPSTNWCGISFIHRGNFWNKLGHSDWAEIRFWKELQRSWWFVSFSAPPVPFRGLLALPSDPLMVEHDLELVQSYWVGANTALKNNEKTWVCPVVRFWTCFKGGFPHNCSICGFLARWGL